ncbi:hypothetical protein KEJ13_08775 [Candidatus Bathyarchaeota archaeon]|nr:hypothetical protein [Candidatus Bathyarchaeota archaeon]
MILIKKNMSWKTEKDRVGGRGLISSRRGQFVIIAALLISLLTLSLSLSIHRLSLHRQQFIHQPVEELVLGLSSDLDRCLAHALGRASEKYYETGSNQLAGEEGRTFISKWVKSVIASYSSLGVGLTMNSSSGIAGKINVDFNLEWGRERGLSQVYTEFRLDIESYGFKGWVGHSGKYVKLDLYPNLLKISEGAWDEPGNTSLVFRLVEGKDVEEKPIPNLSTENIKVWVNLTRFTMVQGNITSLRYLGMGQYNVTFTPKVNNNTMGVSLMVITPGDRVYVAAFIPYRDIYITLRSQLNSSQTPTDLGFIKLGNTTYSPSEEPHPLNPGEYLLKYTPEDGYIFLNWTTTGQVSVDEPYSSLTKAVIYGNGTITAYYAPYTPPQPPPPETGLIVNLSSIEDGGETENLGNIRLEGIPYSLPSSVQVNGSLYQLEYIPDAGYSFVNWTSSGYITILDPSSPTTTASVSGNGSITAHYRALKILLKSRHRMNQLQENLGNTTLDGEVYTLPKLLRILSGEHHVRYNPKNSSYTFIGWEAEGGVIPENSTSIETTLTLIGDGNLTALYDLTPDTPPQNDEDWSTLYVDSGYSLNPIFLCTNTSGKLTPPFSHGEDKQESILESPNTSKNITLADEVKIILHLRPNPPSSVKSINVTLSFRYEGVNYIIGNNSTSINSQGVYELIINATIGNYPNNNNKKVPEGSVFVMNVLVTLKGPPYGTLFFYYGPDKPSRIELYQK